MYYYSFMTTDITVSHNLMTKKKSQKITNILVKSIPCQVTLGQGKYGAKCLLRIFPTKDKILMG